MLFRCILRKLNAVVLVFFYVYKSNLLLVLKIVHLRQKITHKPHVHTQSHFPFLGMT